MRAKPNKKCINPPRFVQRAFRARGEKPSSPRPRAGGSYIPALLCCFVLILFLPALALLGGKPEETPVREETASLPEEAARTLAYLAQTEPEAYAENRFYLIKDADTGEILALTPEAYLKGVVAAEMPASFHTEALKAQAVAAHTYALRQIGEELAAPTPELEGAYLSTDPAHYQAYLSDGELREMWGENFSLYNKKIADAVEAVQDRVMTYQGEPIIAAFHAVSPGYTESAENVWGQKVDYLIPVESEGDALSPAYERAVTVSAQEAEALLLEKFPGVSLSGEPSGWFDILERSPSGTVLTLLAGDREITGREAREVFSLPSADFSVSLADGAFVFDCTGAGHGVGMSQYGADYLARQGYTWEEILSHYYTGVSFARTKL